MTEFTPPAFDGQRALHSPKISFEFFPPKTEEMERSLWETINRLAPLAPNFVSVTYGAGGSTRERTHSTIARILRETSLVPAAHLTCVGAPKGEIVVIIGAATAPERTAEGDAALDGLIRTALERHSIKDAASLVADETGQPRRAIYTRALALARDSQG